MSPDYRDPRGFREMWGSASTGERWAFVAAIPLLVVVICLLGGVPQ